MIIKLTYWQFTDWHQKSYEPLKYWMQKVYFNWTNYSLIILGKCFFFLLDIKNFKNNVTSHLLYSKELLGVLHLLDPLTLEQLLQKCGKSLQVKSCSIGKEKSIFIIRIYIYL